MAQTAATRFDFDALSTAWQMAERKRLRRLRILRRTLHFIGFVSYWAIFAGAVYLLSLAAGIVVIILS